MLDDEIGFFDRGYRSETDGLGIEAFGYYRRFVESHKDKIMDAIRKVAVAQNMPPNKLAVIERAAGKREFKQAVETIKDGIPSSLFIKGHNPLTLLHNALSAGLHNEDDVECLALAQDIRTVLVGLAERTNAALKDSAESLTRRSRGWASTLLAKSRRRSPADLTLTQRFRSVAAKYLWHSRI